MRISSLIKPALLIMAMALPASHAANANPLGSVVTSVAENPNIERVNCYRHRGYYRPYRDSYYGGYRGGYRDYGYDGYRPSYRAYSYRPRYYRDYGYRDYGY